MRTQQAHRPSSFIAKLADGSNGCLKLQRLGVDDSQNNESCGLESKADEAQGADVIGPIFAGFHPCIACKVVDQVVPRTCLSFAGLRLYTSSQVAVILTASSQLYTINGVRLRLGHRHNAILQKLPIMN